jgi:hypothetical protein
MLIRAIASARRHLRRNWKSGHRPAVRRSAALLVNAGGSEFREVSAYSTAGRESGRVVAQDGWPLPRRNPKMVRDEMSWWLC